MKNTAKLLIIALLAVFGVTGIAHAEQKTISFEGQFSQTLRYGMKGEFVKNLQKKIAQKEFYTSAIDGDFGPKTLLAVKKFQASRGLVADGIVGKNTIKKFFEEKAIAENPIFCEEEPFNPVYGSRHPGQTQIYYSMCALRLDGATLSDKKFGEAPPVEKIDDVDVDTDNFADMRLHAKSDLSDTYSNSVRNFFLVSEDKKSLSKMRDIDDLKDFKYPPAEGVFRVNATRATFAKNRNSSFSVKALWRFEEDARYYYKACVSFTNLDNEKELSCGQIKSFESDSVDQNL